MNQLVKLDAISGDGDVKLKKKMQVLKIKFFQLMTITQSYQNLNVFSNDYLKMLEGGKITEVYCGSRFVEYQELNATAT